MHASTACLSRHVVCCHDCRTVSLTVRLPEGCQLVHPHKVWATLLHHAPVTLRPASDYCSTAHLPRQENSFEGCEDLQAQAKYAAPCCHVRLHSRMLMHAVTLLVRMQLWVHTWPCSFCILRPSVSKHHVLRERGTVASFELQIMTEALGSYSWLR